MTESTAYSRSTGELESQIWETVSAAVRRVVDEAVDEIEENPLPARGDLPKLKHKLLR